MSEPRVETEIERLCHEANNAEGAPGYHVTLDYPDGSHLEAPIFAFGPNWAKFDELRDEPLVVDTTDAKIAINWAPGPSQARGPRFDYLNSNAPKI